MSRDSCNYVVQPVTVSPTCVMLETPLTGVSRHRCISILIRERARHPCCDGGAWAAGGRGRLARAGPSPGPSCLARLSDGELDRVPADELAQAVSVVLDEERPTVVATFGPDGVFGHPDHIATDAAFLQQASNDGTAFRRLLHGAVPDSVFQRWNRQRGGLGLVFDPTRIYHTRGVPDEEIGVIVDCRSVSARIVAGLQQHRSQHHVMADDAEDTDRWQRVVTREWYAIALPRSEQAVGLNDILEGLP